MTTGVPDDVRRFILTNIPSVPYLEALLLLRKDASHPWDGKALAGRLYVSEQAADALLAELHVSALLAADEAGTYCYSPCSVAVREMVDRLAATYAAHLIEVTNLIHSKTGKRARQFADAFLWRKDT